MKFWDSSAIVPLIIEEESSKSCRHLLRGDSTQVVWTFTRVEVISALWRLLRNRNLEPEDVRKAESRLEKLSTRWNEVEPVAPVRDTAERLLKVHALRTADALHLAAAITVFGGRTRARCFITLDAVLAGAAEREGFTVIRPSTD